jgi:hypothetical protein
MGYDKNVCRKSSINLTIYVFGEEHNQNYILDNKPLFS